MNSNIDLNTWIRSKTAVENVFLSIYPIHQSNDVDFDIDFSIYDTSKLVQRWLRILSILLLYKYAVLYLVCHNKLNLWLIRSDWQIYTIRQSLSNNPLTTWIVTLIWTLKSDQKLPSIMSFCRYIQSIKAVMWILEVSLTP